MGVIAAFGRPPTAMSASALRKLPTLAFARGQVDISSGMRRVARRVVTQSQIAEKAVEIASDIMDTDLVGAWDTVQTPISERISDVQDSTQDTANLIAATAPAPSLLGMSGPLRALLLLNAGSMLFGSNQVALKFAEESMEPNSISAVRFAIAALCFLPAILRGIKLPQLRGTGLELGMWLFGGYILQALGLEYTTAAHGAFTGTIMVLVVPVLVGLSGRRVPWKTWIAAAVALFGVGLLTTSDATPNVGDGLCILSALLFGVHKWRSEGATMRFRENTQELVALQLGVLATAAFAFDLPSLARTVTSHTPGELLHMGAMLPWPVLIYMGLATTAFTLWVEINALKDVSAPLAALIYTSEPLWGALFAWTLLGEHWGATGWVGAFLIVTASLGSQLGTKGKEEDDQPKSSSKVEVYDT